MRESVESFDLATQIGEMLKQVEHPSLDQGYCKVAIGQIRTLLSKRAATTEDQQLVADIQETLQGVPEISENGPSASAVSRLLRIPAIRAAWQSARLDVEKVLAS